MTSAMAGIEGNGRMPASCTNRLGSAPSWCDHALSHTRLEMIHRFLSATDTERACGTLRKLARHDLSQLAVTGGLAVEIHRLRHGVQPATRGLNDIDFVTGEFGGLPETLASDFLVRHAHPLDPPGKMILQLVDPTARLRVDVFRACGQTMRRTIEVELPTGKTRLIAVEDLVARAARLVLALADGMPVASKHADDYLRLAGLAEPAAVDEAWEDQRRPSHPATFREADELVRRLIPARSNLLIAPQYSNDVSAVCPRCAGSPPFPLADPKLVLSLIGYC
jgi:hypothetical protein